MRICNRLGIRINLRGRFCEQIRCFLIFWDFCQELMMASVFFWEHDYTPSVSSKHHASICFYFIRLLTLLKSHFKCIMLAEKLLCAYTKTLWNVKNTDHSNPSMYRVISHLAALHGWIVHEYSSSAARLLKSSDTMPLSYQVNNFFI